MDVMPARVLTGKTIRELLTGREYSIDYYQREYKWQRKSSEVAALLWTVFPLR